VDTQKVYCGQTEGVLRTVRRRVVDSQKACCGQSEGMLWTDIVPVADCEIAQAAKETNEENLLLYVSAVISYLANMTFLTFSYSSASIMSMRTYTLCYLC